MIFLLYNTVQLIWTVKIVTNVSEKILNTMILIKTTWHCSVQSIEYVVIMLQRQPNVTYNFRRSIKIKELSVVKKRLCKLNTKKCIQY